MYVDILWGETVRVGFLRREQPPPPASYRSGKLSKLEPPKKYARIHVTSHY